MKRFVLMIIAPLLVLLPAVALVEPVYACGHSSASQQVFNGIDETGGKTSCDDSGVNATIKQVIEILSFVVGVASVIAIISGGFKYITSGGDAGKVSNAKSTLIYAMIGIAIAALAQVLVHFVITAANQSANSCQLTNNGNTTQGVVDPTTGNCVASP